MVFLPEAAVNPPTKARSALARAVFFNRLGEIRDRSLEQQRYRASGLNLLTAAIILWNTVNRTGLEHINLTGDYTWPRANHIKPGRYRPLRRSAKP
jgi:hypothetical protein